MLVENQIAGVIGAAMRHHVAHRHDQVEIDLALARAIFPYSADAAHDVTFEGMTTYKFQAGAGGRAFGVRTLACASFQEPVSTEIRGDQLSSDTVAQLVPMAITDVAPEPVQISLISFRIILQTRCKNYRGHMLAF